MNIRDRIWHELVDSKKQEQYLCLYLASAKKCKRLYKLLLITVSVLGIALVQFQPVSIFIFALIAIVEVAKNLLPEWLPNEQLMEKLPEYRMLVLMKFEKMDELWMKLNSGTINDQDASKEYFNIRREDKIIENMDNSIWLPEKRDLMTIATNDVDIYLENHYGVKNDQ